MKRTTFLITVAIFFSLVNSDWVTKAQNGCVSIGTGGVDRGFDVVPLSGGGFVVIGYTDGIGSGLRDAYMARLNSDGTLGWGMAFGGSANEELYDAVYIGGNQYALVGYTRSYGLGSADILLLSIDESGNILNAYTFGGSGSEQGKHAIVTNDGNLAIAGFTYSFSSGLADGYVIVVDLTGNVVWGKGLGGSGDERFRGIVQSSSGKYFAIGYTDSYGAGGYDFYLAGFTSSGNLLWTRTVGGTGDDYGQSIVVLNDGSLIGVGYTSSFGAGGEDIFIVKLDTLGNVKWTKTIGGGGNERAWEIITLSDGNLLIVGQSNSYGAGGTDGYVVKIDTSGTILWTRTVGGASNDYLRAGEEKSNGQILLAGWTASFSLGSDDIFLVKLDSKGLLSSTCMDCVIDSGGIVTNVSGSVGSGGNITDGGNSTTPSTSTNGGGSLLTTCVLSNSFIYLSGIRTGDFIRLRWHTSMETFDYFVVTHFNKQTGEFETIDILPAINGVYEYYTIVHWEYEQPGQFQIYGVLARGDHIYSNIWFDNSCCDKTGSIRIVYEQDDNILNIVATKSQLVNITITDGLGRTVMRDVKYLQKGENRLTVPKLPTGIYLIHVNEVSERFYVW